MQSEGTSLEAAGQTLHVSRTWRSPVADVDFRTIQGGGESAGKTQVEPETIHGTGGVVITSESRRGDAAAVPAKMAADEVTGTFGAGSALRTLVGTGHAQMEQTTATGAHQTASGDQLEVSFAPPQVAQNREQGSGNREQKTGVPGNRSGTRTTDQDEVQTAELDGHVVLFEQPAAKPGAQPQPPMRATAGKAVYEGDGEWLHLTMNPRDREWRTGADCGQGGCIAAIGRRFCAWQREGDTDRRSAERRKSGSGVGQGSLALGGNGPAHVIAAEAQLNESTGEATFRGHARLWQQANSVAAPEIVLNQHLQTLTARTTDAV